MGNHEFDDGVAGVVPFIKGLNAPVVVANLDAKNEPDMQGIVKKSVVITRGSKKIGIIGSIIANVKVSRVLFYSTIRIIVKLSKCTEFSVFRQFDYPISIKCCIAIGPNHRVRAVSYNCHKTLR